MRQVLSDTLVGDFFTGVRRTPAQFSVPCIWVVFKIMAPFGYPKYKVPYYNKDPKRGPNIDNHPYAFC